MKLVRKLEQEVVKIIDELRPFLMNDGGNIEFIKIEDNIVYVMFQGACMDCMLQDFTLKDGIEKMIINKVPQIKEVRLYEEDN